MAGGLSLLPCSATCLWENSELRACFLTPERGDDNSPPITGGSKSVWGDGWWPAPGKHAVNCLLLLLLHRGGQPRDCHCVYRGATRESSRVSAPHLVAGGLTVSTQLAQ